MLSKYNLLLQIDVPDFNAEEEMNIFAYNRKKYRQESNNGITTLQRFKKFNKIHINSGDPILTMVYPQYYLSIFGDRKQFVLEVEACKSAILNINQRRSKNN